MVVQKEAKLVGRKGVQMVLKMVSYLDEQMADLKVY
jgi:hypothetical protein